MKIDTLKELYVEELRDLYSAETQSLKALPRMVRAANNVHLKEAFQSHLHETEEQVQRLEQIFAIVGATPKGRTCEGMKGLLKEADEWMDEDAEPDVMDAGLISAAQRVEHYEISGYGTVRTHAELLGDENAVELLEETLQEEKAADARFGQVAIRINVEANNRAA
ncbi:MAG TPA: ferritin-like domain-containing protein [Acidisarcina sp.]|nr:ferritin-like domain-containing protein [Acidisarcina sp.]